LQEFLTNSFLNMKNPILITKEQERINDLSHEAMQILEILDQIENHTAALRKKLVSEFSVKSENVSLKLDNI
jgi:hypothetical protein